MKFVKTDVRLALQKDFCASNYDLKHNFYDLRQKISHEQTRKNTKFCFSCFRVYLWLIVLKFFWGYARELFEGAIEGGFGIETRIERDAEQI